LVSYCRLGFKPHPRPLILHPPSPVALAAAAIYKVFFVNFLNFW
jgi:hypothetical protein